MAFNILEAVSLDLRNGHALNALGGPLLILCQPYSSEDMWIEGEPADILVAPRRSPVLQAAWNLAYTWWNSVFVMNNFLHHGGVEIFSPLVAALLQRAAWSPAVYCQSRVYTLFASMFIFMVYWPWHPGPDNLTSGASVEPPPWLAARLQYVSPALVVVLVALRFGGGLAGGSGESSTGSDSDSE